tara:strand:- start:702 stop:1211 length:510 start_codon:yes stop_codon:yes gene_type:complete
MKKLIFFLFLFYSIIFNSKAEIAYIDISYILNESDVGKSLNSYIQSIKNKDITKYKELENELKKKENTLIAQKNILNEEEFQKKLSILTLEVKKFRSDKKLSIDELKKIKIENTKEILKVLNPIITEYVELNSISIVLPKKNIIVGKKNLDITNQIINLLNQDIKEFDF